MQPQNNLNRVGCDLIVVSLVFRFLAAMSSSRSDVVTQFVRPFVTKEFFFSLKSFNGVSRKLKGCLKLKGCFMEILFMF